MQDRITRSRFVLDPADLLLRPVLDDFQLMDFHRAREAIAAGRACVEQAAARPRRSLARPRPAAGCRTARRPHRPDEHARTAGKRRGLPVVGRGPCEERGFVLDAVGIDPQVVRPAGPGRGGAGGEHAEGTRRSSTCTNARIPRAGARRRRAAASRRVGRRGRPRDADRRHRLPCRRLCAGARTGSMRARGRRRRRAPANRGARSPRSTLHLDVGHLLANRASARSRACSRGSCWAGIAWATVLAVAGAADFVNAFIQPATHFSVGASTACSPPRAARGLRVAPPPRLGDRWAYRWAPLIAGVILLGSTGAGGERIEMLRT